MSRAAAEPAWTEGLGRLYKPKDRRWADWVPEWGTMRTRPGEGGAGGSSWGSLTQPWSVSISQDWAQEEDLGPEGIPGADLGN